jgi:hypothetical protein
MGQGATDPNEAGRSPRARQQHLPLTRQPGRIRPAIRGAARSSDQPLCFLELFRSDRFADVSLNQWMALTPPELVQAHLNLDAQTLAALSRDKPIIVR